MNLQNIALWNLHIKPNWADFPAACPLWGSHLSSCLPSRFNFCIRDEFAVYQMILQIFKLRTDCCASQHGPSALIFFSFFPHRLLPPLSSHSLYLPLHCLFSHCKTRPWLSFVHCFVTQIVIFLLDNWCALPLPATLSTPGQRENIKTSKALEWRVIATRRCPHSCLYCINC